MGRVHGEKIELAHTGEIKNSLHIVINTLHREHIDKPFKFSA